MFHRVYIYIYIIYVHLLSCYCNNYTHSALRPYYNKAVLYSKAFRSEINHALHREMRLFISVLPENMKLAYCTSRKTVPDFKKEKRQHERVRDRLG